MSNKSPIFFKYFVENSSKNEKNNPKNTLFCPSLPKKLKKFHTDTQRVAKKNEKRLKKILSVRKKVVLLHSRFERENVRLVRAEIIEETETEGSVPGRRTIKGRAVGQE